MRFLYHDLDTTPALSLSRIVPAVEPVPATHYWLIDLRIAQIVTGRGGGLCQAPQADTLRKVSSLVT